MREAGVKEKGALKTARLKFFPKAKLAKPAWIRVRAPAAGSRFHEIKQILREQKLHTVCEEASCPNIGECFGKGTATFMILGDICTRRCPFCDVAHGRPLAPDTEEPLHLAETIRKLNLSYVVITSVDRDDLKDAARSTSSIASAPCARTRRAPRSKSWYQTSGGASSARWQCSRPRRRT